MTACTWAKEGILVSLYDEAGLAGEQFRKLQVKIRALRRAAGGRLASIAVTSPLTGDGKTACSANLAIALSREPGRKVLLLDCDLRKARIGRFVEPPPARGLADVLAGRAAIEETAVEMPGGVLDVVAAGSLRDNGGPPRALRAERLKELLAELADRYEFVVCDAPPLLPTADAAALSEICDGTLLVIRAGATPRPAAARALASVNKQKLIGFLLNAVPESQLGRYYYSGYDDGEGKQVTGA